MERLDLDKWYRAAEEYCSVLVALLRDGDESLRNIGELVKERLKEHRERSKVSFAFVGQYNAGKSTIISALTGRDDIAISTDITTDRCTPYEWLAAGLRLVDTPGLYTERQDHDQMTNQEIERSDLIAFALTVALFDHITLPKFRELAVEHRYWPKMLLVVNKLFSEAGDPEERIEHYRENLNQMFGSTTVLRSVPVVFVDAKLYLEGAKNNNGRLVEKSRFRALIAALNKLSQERDLLGRADTAIRLVLGGTNEAILALSGGEKSDVVFLHLLNRYLELITSGRKALRREFRNAANAAARVVLEEGAELMAALDGSEQEQFAVSERQCHQRVRDRIEEIQNELQRKILEIGTLLQRDVKEIQSLPLFEQFARRMKEGGGGVEKVASRLLMTPRLERQMGVLQNVAIGLGGLLAPSSKAGAQTAAKASQGVVGALTRSGTERVTYAERASGSWHTGGQQGVAMTYLDDAIKNTVDHINSTFHLHLSSDAMIRASHSTSHFLQAVGPILALGAAANSVWGMIEEKAAVEALGRVRQEIHDKFSAARDQIVEKFERQGATFDSDVLTPLQKEVLAKREDAEAEMVTGNERLENLRELRARLEASLEELGSTPW